MVQIRSLPLISFCCCLLFTVASSPVAAATHTVSNNGDTGAGSLRQTVIDAGSGDTINFSFTGTITLTTGSITISKNLTITGPGSGSLTIDGNANDQIFVVNGAWTVSISDLTLNNASTGGSGGAIDNEGGTLTVTRCVLSNSTAALGGGVYQNGGTLDMTDCTVSGNTGVSNGGGVYLNSGTTTMTGCTISGNTATQTGGGLYNNQTTFSLTNCTISGNIDAAADPDGGGGIYTVNGAPTLTNCTITDNQSDGSGGGVYVDGALTVSNTIIAGNRDNNGYPDCYRTGTNITSNGYNLVGSKSNCYCNQGTDIETADPKLDALADNGGSTKTHALQSGSPALDAGSTGLTTDQRGISRPQYCGDDIGAYELVSTEACPNPTDDPNDPSVSGGPIDRFGAPPEMVPFSLNGQVSELTCPLTLRRSIPFSSDSGRVPGLIFRWIGSDGVGRDNWLPLGGAGTMANGIAWTTSLRDYYGRSIVDLTFTLPDDFCDGLEPGRQTIEYLFKIGDGAKSNFRREYLDYNGNVSSTSPDRTTSAQGNDELIFKLMVCRYDSSSRQLTRFQGENIKFSSAGETVQQAELVNGLAEISLVMGQAGKLIIEPDDEEAITFKVYYENGFLKLTNRCDQTGTPHGPADIGYYRLPDGAYAIEYYRNRIFITNQADPAGPISGLIYRAP